LLAIIEDPDNNGITTIENVVVISKTGCVVSVFDMEHPSKFKPGYEYNIDTCLSEHNLLAIAGGDGTDFELGSIDENKTITRH